MAKTKPEHAKLLDLRSVAGMTGDEAAAAAPRHIVPAPADRMTRSAKARLAVEISQGRPTGGGVA